MTATLSPPRNRVTREEYLRRERESIRDKSIFINGRIYPMAGGTGAHNQISGNVYRHLGNQCTDGAFKFFIFDLKVRIDSADAICYPDVTVVRGKAQYMDKPKDVLTNPQVVVEVHSPSTRAHDLRIKLHHYISIPSVQEILYIEGEDAVATLHTRRGEQWFMQTFRGMDATVRFETLPFNLSMRQIFEGVEFDEDDTPLDDAPAAS